MGELEEARHGFFTAAQHGRSDVIKTLAEHAIGRIDWSDLIDPDSGNTPIHVAIQHGQVDAVRALLAAGFPPDLGSATSAYAMAVESGAKDLVFVFHQFIIQKIAENHVDGVQQLLRSGIDVRMTDTIAQNTLLHWAVSCDSYHVLKFLLSLPPVQQDKLFDRRNADGFTPLHLASRANQFQSVQLLLEHSADPSIVCDRGNGKGRVAAELTTSNDVMRLLQLTPEASTNVVKRQGGGDSGRQIAKYVLQLEEKDILIDQLKHAIEELVTESEERKKFGEENRVLEYVRSLRHEKAKLEQQLADAEEYIQTQEMQLEQLKTQIRELSTNKQEHPSKKESTDDSAHVSHATNQTPDVEEESSRVASPVPSALSQFWRDLWMLDTLDALDLAEEEEAVV